MFEGFSTFHIKTQSDPEVIITGFKSGDASSSPLPPLLLLHGFPQTRHMWHRVVPHLVDKYTLIVPDLRGYGDSSKPKGVESYVKSAMARDFVAVMDQLGYDGPDKPFYVCAHDRGARVAHKLCVDHPQRVKAAMLLDICPTLAMYTATNFEFAKSYFHWFFLIQAPPLPETAILNSAESFTELYMGARGGESVSIFDQENVARYKQCFSTPETVHGMCNDYRASASLDMDEAREDLAHGRRIQCPLTVLWGTKGVIERDFECIKEWQAVTDPSIKVDGYSVKSSHYIPEEVPDEVVAAINKFFV